MIELQIGERVAGQAKEKNMFHAEIKYEHGGGQITTEEFDFIEIDDGEDYELSLIELAEMIIAFQKIGISSRVNKILEWNEPAEIWVYELFPDKDAELIVDCFFVTDMQYQSNRFAHFKDITIHHYDENGFRHSVNIVYSE
jgi:hypothetical protein